MYLLLKGISTDKLRFKHLKSVLTCSRRTKDAGGRELVLKAIDILEERIIDGILLRGGANAYQ